MGRFVSRCLNRLSSRSCAFLGCCFCSVSRCQSTLYAILGEVSFMALISIHANSFTSRALASRCSCAITCRTVAVLPVPGTPLTSARVSIVQCVGLGARTYAAAEFVVEVVAHNVVDLVALCFAAWQFIHRDVRRQYLASLAIFARCICRLRVRHILVFVHVAVERN